MKKISKILSAASVLGVAVVAAACGKNGKTGAQVELQMWTGFGKDYTGEIEKVVNKYNEDKSGSVHITHTSQNNYNKLETNISNSIDGRTFPHFANGYPDHFAEYCHKGIMIPLDKYIQEYNTKHNTDLMSDFYPQYTKENETIRYDSVSRKGYIMGLPFNKSTEVMVSNGYLVDYVKDVDPTIAVPANGQWTWQQIASEGPKIVAAMANAKYGKAVTATDAKFLVGKVDANNVASDFRISDAANRDAVVLADGEKILQDISKVTASSFRVLGYDSGENAFITMLHQWGAKYTEFSVDIYFDNHEYGYARFWDNNNKAKTLTGLEFIKDLYDAKCFGLPQDWQLTNFCTDAFEDGQCLFTVGSSGGLSNSTDASKRIEVLPVPHYNDGVNPAVKAVISQGTSLGLLNQFSSKDKKEAEQQAAFDAMVELCTGERQASWVTATGYFPASKSAFNSQTYQDLLNDPNPSALRKMYQSAGQVNKNVYDAEGWDKFVDPGFLGSSAIRSKIGNVIRNVTTGARDNISTYMDTVWGEIDPNVKQ